MLPVWDSRSFLSGTKAMHREQCFDGSSRVQGLKTRSKFISTKLKFSIPNLFFALFWHCLITLGFSVGITVVCCFTTDILFPFLPVSGGCQIHEGGGARFCSIVPAGSWRLSRIHLLICYVPCKDTVVRV